jgi:uncharacterized protein (DUF2062 family)
MKLRERLRRLSLANTPPETIALSVVLGVTLGVFPIYGCPTLLCVAAALVLRPHVPLLQAINAITGPLQFALVLPFHRLGRHLLPAVKAGVAGFTLRMIVGWFFVCLPIGLCLYAVLRFWLRRRAKRAETLAPAFQNG